MLAGLFACLNLVDGWMAGFLPELPRIFAWGFTAGILGIFLYAAASNQAEIGRLKRQARMCRSRLLDPKLEDADFSRLTKLNLKVSLRLLARVSGPALLSAVPILMAALWMNAVHSQSSGGEGKAGDTAITGMAEYMASIATIVGLPAGRLEKTLMENLPEWLSGWEAPYFISVFIAALGIKLVFRLE